MTEEQFDILMRDAAKSYRVPPQTPSDEMWAAIELQALATPVPGNGAPRLWGHSWMRIAAVLLIGVVIGRGSSMLPLGESAQPALQASIDSISGPSRSPFSAVTDNYLAQTTALLISLPEELRSARTDAGYLSRADYLLMQTRMLLDSPVAADPGMKSLFEDLETVLAQVVRLPADRDSMEVELLTQALERRDVLPRLRSAVADHIAD